MTDRSHPIEKDGATEPSRPASVRDALTQYHCDNGFQGDAMTAETLQVHVGGKTFNLPNPHFQRHLLAKHDLHHVVTEYLTDWVGEAEMGAWELAAGSGHWFVALNNVGALMMGVVAPLRTWRAFARGRRSRSLYRLDIPYDELLSMDLADLRARLRVGPDHRLRRPKRRRT